MRIRIAVAALAALLASLSAAPQAFAERRDMPEFHVQRWISDKTVTWDDLQGRPYVAEFWATWCPPCRESIPHLNKLNRMYEPLGVPIVALTSEPLAQEKQIREFAEEYEMNYYVGFDPNLGRALEVRGIPHAAVVDHQGRIAWTGNPLSPDFDGQVHRVVSDWMFPQAQFPNTRALAGQALRETSGEALGELRGMEGEEARRALSALNDAGEKMAAGLAPLREQSPAEHAAAMQQLAKRFAGLPAGLAAKEEAERALADPTVADDVGVMTGLESLKKDFNAKLRETVQAAPDRAEAMRRALPLFEQAVKDLDDLLARHPRAQRTESAQKERAQFQRTLEAIRRSLAQE